jgi:hypothetical protein
MKNRVVKGKRAERAELKDYSGEFRPDLKMEDFSKEALVKLWQLGAKLYIGLDGLYYSLNREKFGEDKARELAVEVWLRKGFAADQEVRRGREAMNIWGDDVASLFKFFQIDPGCAGVMPDVKYELKGKNHGIFTVKRCLSLEYFEKHGETSLQKHACEDLDILGFQRAAELFNPKIKATAVKLPPRKNREEIACQWEFKIEE